MAGYGTGTGWGPIAGSLRRTIRRTPPARRTAAPPVRQECRTYTQATSLRVCVSVQLLQQLEADLIDPMPNARQITGPLLSLMTNAQQRYRMAEQMREHAPRDGADTIAEWLMVNVG